MNFDSWFNTRMPKESFLLPNAMLMAFREIAEQAWNAGRDALFDEPEDTQS